MFDAWQWLKRGGDAADEREAMKRARIEAAEYSLIYLDSFVREFAEIPPPENRWMHCVRDGERRLARVQGLLSKLRGDHEGVDPAARARMMTRERVRRWRERRKPMQESAA